MSYVQRNSSYYQRDKNESWIPESYLSEMRTRLSKLRSLQEEFSDDSSEETVASH